MPLQPIIYPGAIWRPLEDFSIQPEDPEHDHSAPGLFSQKKQITDHITQGPTANSAWWTFKSSLKPKRTSSHIIIEQDGKVYQIVDFNRIAWHASAVNEVAIGIEHVAIAGKVFASEAQYEASAKLHNWLCREMGIPIDRQHIRQHCEAAPADHHDLCCHGALDIDRVVQMANALG